MDHKEQLHGYLKVRRADLLGKLDGLGEYDARRPLVPTGTNLIGLIKHVASTQLGYFTDVFGRPADRPIAWDMTTDADMWATADESLAEIIDFHHYSNEQTDATIQALDIDAPGRVPWWPGERGNVTLHQILVHMTVETSRHAGHADILRELIDGSVGNGPNDPNISTTDAAHWVEVHDTIERAAREAAGRAV